MTRRKIETSAVSVAAIDNPELVLTQLIGIPESAIMLAHCDDGIVWGRRNGNDLVCGGHVDAECSVLSSLETLIEARFFWDSGEVHIWRDGTGQLKGCRVEDGAASSDFVGYYDEAQILWGTKAERVKDGWTRMSDGAQGLVHVVPLDVSNWTGKSDRRLRLMVRNYLKEHECTGTLYVVLSRLVKLEVV